MGVGARERALGKDHVAEQARQEVAFAAAFVRGQHGALEPVGARDAAEQSVDRSALLSPADEVDTPQQWVGFELRGRKHLRDELVQQAAQCLELLWKGVDARAPRRVSLELQALDQAVRQALFERVEFGAELRQIDALLRIQRECETPGRGARVLVDVAEVVDEAGKQIALRDEQVDRKPQCQVAVQLLDAPTHRGAVLGALFGAARQQVADRHRDQHAVQRLARPAAFEQAEEAFPGLAVGGLVAVVRRVAAGGIDQHRLIGEPPVAVARAADAAHRGFAQPVGERKLEPRIHQRRRLAGAGRADDRVPRQFIQIAFAQARREARPRRCDAGLALIETRRPERFERLRKPFAEQFQLCVGRPRCAVGRRLDEQLIDDLGVGGARPPSLPELAQHHQRDDDADADPAGRDRFERTPVGDCEQRADDPDHERQRSQPEHEQ